MDDTVSRRLTDIERRLAGIEAALHLQATPTPLDAAPLPLEHKREIFQAYAAHHAQSKAAAEAQVGSDPHPENTRRSVETPITSPAAAAAHALPPPLPVPVPVLKVNDRDPAAAARVNPTFEQTVGLQWAGWIGAVVLVIGAALGFKFAYDQGWLGRFPPQAKLGLLTIIGLAVLAVGEVVYRRINRISAAGFFGAGTAILFLASYAGHAWYGLYLDQTAIALMGASAMVGVLVSARADMVSVAVLAIIGGNVAPLLMDNRFTSELPFLIYLLFLQGMALGLCVWQARPKWWPLRGLTLATTTFWMLALIINGPARSAAIELIFALLFALLFQIELCWSTLRANKRALSQFQSATGTVFSLLVTCALALCCVAIEDGASRLHMGLMILGLAATAAGAGFALMRWRQSALSAIALSFRIQSVLLLILAVPVSLHGPSVLFGWMLLAVALSMLSAATGRRLAMVGATMTWLLAIAFWAGWASSDPHAMDVWLTLGQPLQARLIVAACLALSGHIMAATLRRLQKVSPEQPPADATPVILLDIAAVSTLAVSLYYFVSPTAASVVGIVYSILLFTCSYLPGFTQLGPIALLLLSVVTMKWAILDVLQPRFDRVLVVPQRLLINPQAALGLALAICFGAMGWLEGRRRIDSQPSIAARRNATLIAALFALVLFIVGFTLTMEVDRYWLATVHSGNHTGWPGTTARDLMFTILWSGCLAAWMFVCKAAVRETSVWTHVLRAALILSLLLGCKFIACDVILPRLDASAAPVAIGLNIQVLAGLCVLGLVSSAIALAKKTPLAAMADRCVIAAPLLLLVIGSAEIDRYASYRSAGPAWIVRQVGWSIYWSALAVLLLIIGFMRQLKALRVTALGLLGITLAKVTLVDLSTAGSGWRILSFIGLGVLLLATSVLYGKFSHRPGLLSP